MLVAYCDFDKVNNFVKYRSWGRTPQMNRPVEKDQLIDSNLRPGDYSQTVKTFFVLAYMFCKMFWLNMQMQNNLNIIKSD